MKIQRYKIIHAGHIGNPKLKIEDNQQKHKGLNTLPSLVDTGEEDSKATTFFHTPSPVLCEYQKDICPKNIPKYSMKCIYHNKECSIKKYFDRYRRSDLIKLGIGSRL